jgi:hypothetical protein
MSCRAWSTVFVRTTAEKDRRGIYLLVSFSEQLLSISIVCKASPRAEGSLSFWFTKAWDLDWVSPSGEMSNENSYRKGQEKKKRRRT